MADDTTPRDEPSAEEPKYDQAFFLALAAKGKDAWNAWRRDPANEYVRVTFASVDFSEGPYDEINFARFEFGDYVDFSGCTWRGVEWKEIRDDRDAFKPGRAFFTGAAFGFSAYFRGADFGSYTDFAGAAFDVSAKFIGAAFGVAATFTGTVFGDAASFAGAAFGGGANFSGATLGRFANFTGAAFGHFANFTGAVIGYNADFTGVSFAGGADFEDTIFKGQVEFTGKSEKQWTSDLASVEGMSNGALIEVKQRHEESWTHYGSGPDRFLAISFANARFDGGADFSGRSFEVGASFTDARFYYPPEFDAAANAGRIDFTGAHIGFVPPGKLHWTSKTEVLIRLRALRKIAEETKNHDLERDLYIEERKAERGVYLVQLFKYQSWRNLPRNAARLIAHLLWIAVMGVYWALADYGRSFVRPFAWLIASGLISYYWGYPAVLAAVMPHAGTPDAEKYDHAVGMLALGNSVPFVGQLTIDSELKKFLFCPGGAVNCLPIPQEGYQLLVVGQNLLSIILVFFIGLALRNYFKIK
ncbi:MAG: pentapeptide repeat-containing protein [Methylocella sp.]